MCFAVLDEKFFGNVWHESGGIFTSIWHSALPCSCVRMYVKRKKKTTPTQVCSLYLSLSLQPMSIETDSEEDETNTARNRLSSVTLAGEEEVCTGGGAEDADSSRPCSPPTTIHDAVALCVFDLNALLYVATPSDAMMPIVQVCIA